MKLQQQVVENLVEEGVLAVAQSPCNTWRMSGGQVVSDNVESLLALVEAGFVPVIHGDCVLDDSKGCCILSGDTVIKHICEKTSVGRVLFLTDVDGIYNRPPEVEGASLLPVINIKSSGDTDIPFLSSKSEFDVTGGIALKLNTAFKIVWVTGGKTPVFICKVGSPAATSVVLQGDFMGEKGTRIQIENLQ
ncbi:uncharacterized protein LOC106152890 isoform X2 [Lingula anatina]|nr:uncharacterized protein LOC106152890 isoform X2 [Lingula anatina]|eukprot:XP_013382082.1 uncharacterized protein LOC106152890 isoform X2 [Lingula anatina]